jgi:hypothetical protein
MVACLIEPTPIAKPLGVPPKISDHRPTWTSHAVAASRRVSRSGFDQGSTRASRLVAFANFGATIGYEKCVAEFFISVS